MNVRMIVIMLFLVHVTGNSGADELINDLDKPVPLAHVQGVAGHRALLPCDTRPLDKGDLVSMVLWFKESEGEPLYSYDVRGRTASQPALWSAPGGFGARAHFRAAAPAALMLDSVRAADAGVYRCRVDFRNSPTRNLRLNFTIITPPQPPTITDAKTRDSVNRLQPYNEGDSVDLRCETFGGEPRPNLTWYLENTLIDDSFDQLPDAVTINSLTLPTVGRQHFKARLVCQASNTQLAPPETKLIILDVNLKPLSVQILNKSRHLSADKSYEIRCRAVGSRPDAAITWLKDARPIRKNSKNFSDNNVTVSVLSLTPLPEDHDKTLICRAENPKIPLSTIEDKWRLNVHYLPEVTMKIGSSLNPDLIKEGDDVYFECSVSANPQAYRLSWYKESAEIQHNVTAGIILSDQSLILRRVRRTTAGNYHCLAQNSEGSAQSNSVFLVVRYAPICNNANQVEVYGALKQESVDLQCSVDASPQPRRFTWTLQAVGEHLDLTDSKVSTSGPTSTLTYTPLRDADFGTILCAATNAVGAQETPCIYKLVAAGKPMPVQNCTLNHSLELFQVDCTEGYDGGLAQVFYMEVLPMLSKEVEANMSSAVAPRFEYRVRDRKVSYNLRIYAANSKGRSQSILLSTSALNPTGERASAGVPSWLVGLLCAVALLCAGACAVLAALYAKHFPTSGNNKKYTRDGSNLFMDRSMETVSKQDTTFSAAFKAEYFSEFELKVDQDDIDPDIIPCGYETKYLENFDATSKTSRTNSEALGIYEPDAYSNTEVTISVVNRGLNARTSDSPRIPEVVTSSRRVRESCI